MLRKLRAKVAPAIKQALSHSASLSGLYRLAGETYGGVGVYLILHRVLPSGTPLLWPGYAIDADQLESTIVTVRRMGWEIVGPEEAHRRIMQPQKGDGRFVCFTLDDGYADNLEVALPVFEKHGAPFCVYVCTGLVNREVFYWWGALEALVHASTRVEFTPPGGTVACALPSATLEEKAAAYEEILAVCDDHGPGFAADLLRRYGVDAQAVMDRDFMTQDQVRKLASHQLVTIGGHCVAHERLSPMTDDEVWKELDEGRRTLEGWIGKEVRHLAYPFGAANACGTREFELAKKAGYVTAVTTRRGNIFPEHRDHLTCLPRREVPVNLVRLRNALYGTETIFRKSQRFQTA